MASVFLATQESTGRTVAIKIMAKHLDSRWADRFLDEARRLAELSHPNIVPVFDWGTNDGIGYIVMEFIKGGDLTQRLSTRRISIREALEIMRQIASGLDFAGEKGCIHRDVKPENILFREDGSPCILDFGIAKASDSNTTISSQGIAIGTGAYMSPEQAQPAGRQVDARSDLYSLGVVFYEMLTGAKPFDYPDFEPLQAFQLYIFAHVNSPPPPLPDHLSVFQPILDKLLAKNPEDRFRRGNDIRHALNQLEAQLPKEILSRPLRRIEEPTLILFPPAASSAAHSAAISAPDISPARHYSGTPKPLGTPAQPLEPKILSSAPLQTPPGTIKKHHSIAPALAVVVAVGGAGSFFTYEYLVKPPSDTKSPQSEKSLPSAPKAVNNDLSLHQNHAVLEETIAQQQIAILIADAEKLKATAPNDVAQRIQLFSKYDAILKVQPENEFARSGRETALNAQREHTNDLIQTMQFDKALEQTELLEALESPFAATLKQDIAKAQEQERQAREQEALAAKQNALREAIENKKALERNKAIAAEKQNLLTMERLAERSKAAELAEAERQKSLQLKKEQVHQAEIERLRQAKEKARLAEIEKQNEIKKQTELAKQTELTRQMKIEKQMEQERFQEAARQQAEQERIKFIANPAEPEKQATIEKPKTRSFGSF